LPSTIMLTSGSDAGDVTRSRELGAEAYLVKPVRRNELQQAILRILTTHPKPAPAPARQRGVERLGDALRRASSSGLRILVVEDNLINQKYALSTLEKEGYTAVPVDNGR